MLNPHTFPTYLAPTFSPMMLADIPAIMELEPLCFPTPWTAATYRRELTRNEYGSYWVVRPGKYIASQSMAPTQSAQDVPQILAYAGMWLLGEEAHLTTIATHPQWRRRKLGEWLLLHMLGVAREDGVHLVTLEVRMHNRRALALYKKLGFEEVGVRRGYYVDTGDDAMLLTLFALDDSAMWRHLEDELATITRT